MSKATEWTESLEATARLIEAKRPRWKPGAMVATARVSGDGRLELMHGGQWAQSFIADDAIELARWILDTFDETPEAFVYAPLRGICPGCNKPVHHWYPWWSANPEKPQARPYHEDCWRKAQTISETP